MRERKNKLKKKRSIRSLVRVLSFLLIFCMLSGCADTAQTEPPAAESTDSAVGSLSDTKALTETNETKKEPSTEIGSSVPTEISAPPALDIDKVPLYSGTPYTAINNNVPFFDESDYTTASYELYGALDTLGRCTTVMANVSVETMPTEDRGSIGQVKPSGWQTVKYDIVDGKYLYNRCHLIGYQLTGENANKENLVTGTRYMNVDGMLVFENMVADYIKEERESHVLYRVTPVFVGDELVCRGVLMEAYSVEDRGEGISFCVFCYNVQPQITINYADGTSALAEGNGTEAETEKPTAKVSYTLNTNTKKFHYPSCAQAKKIADKNKDSFIGTRDELIKQGYSPCGSCKP